MKLEMDLKPKDIVLLKVLGCVLIAFVMIRFLIFPGIEKHMDLVDQRDEVVAEQEDMQALIDRMDTFDAIIANQQSSLKSAQEGYYDLLENREVDELITGIVLNHNLFSGLSEYYRYDSGCSGSLFVCPTGSDGQYFDGRQFRRHFDGCNTRFRCC